MLKETEWILRHRHIAHGAGMSAKHSILTAMVMWLGVSTALRLLMHGTGNRPIERRKMMNITKGKIEKALRIVLYGVEGIGKTTFASQMPGAVFCDTEGSTTHMDVARFDKPEKWMDIHAAIDWTMEHPDQVGTFVLDTADWAEKLCARYVCEEEPINKAGDVRGWKNIEDAGYGKGYVYMKTAFQKLLDRLTQLTDMGVNVCITAHAILKKFEQPDEMGAYDRWSLKLNEKNISPLLKEWGDMVLFANYKTDVVKTSDGKTKGKGGQKRIMYTQHSACWDAKNRFGLPDEMPFDFGGIANLFPAKGHVDPVKPEPVEPQTEEIPKPERVAPTATVEKSDKVPTPKKKGKCPPAPAELQSEDPNKNKLLDALWMNMWLAGISDPAVIRAVVAEKGYYDADVSIADYDYDFIEGCLIDAWDQVRSLAQTKANDLPF